MSCLHPNKNVYDDGYWNCPNCSENGNVDDYLLNKNDMEPHSFGNLGGKDKKVDPNDIKLGAAAPVVYTFPKELTNKAAWDAPVEYQGDEPACGAHAGAKMKGLSRGKRFSPRAQWGDLKAFDGWAIDDGTDIRSVFKSVTKNLGAVEFDLYGNDVSLPSTEYAKVLTTALRQAGVKYIGDGYGFINDLSWYGLKQFIADHGPTILLVRVGNEWWTDKKGRGSWQEKDILPLRIPNPAISGHFVVAHSFDEEYIYFINSFGETWGRKGHGYFGKEYIPFINDAGALFPLAFTRDLMLGIEGKDVKELQKYLNAHGCILATTGLGSPGNETEYFGQRTKDALIKFQQKSGINPPAGYFGPLTRAYVQLHP